MDFIRNFQLTPLNILKAGVVGVLGLVALVFVLSIAGSTFQSVRDTITIGGYGGGGTYAVEESAVSYDGAYESFAPSPAAFTKSASLSIRNALSSDIFPPVYPRQGTTGDDAEAFEVTDYNGTIETSDAEDTCADIHALKTKSYVIFESANQHDRGCNYSFKVRHENVKEIVAFIEELDPKEFSENTYTIKNHVEDFTSETEILTKKLESIDETLKKALAAYDEISTIATRSQNADSLAKIIDSKIQLIERLTQERINVSTQLDRLARSKAEQLDRLEYTNFSLSVYERTFINSEDIVDSWKNALAQTFARINESLQLATLGLLAFFVMLIQWIVYIVVIVIVAKYLWRFGKYMWMR